MRTVLARLVPLLAATLVACAFAAPAVVPVDAVAHPDDSVADQDHDGVNEEPFGNDNCANANNTDQRDTDLDGEGDECDGDDDGDGVDDAADTCRLIPNADQRDTDADGDGDACDLDDDSDRVRDSDDNCRVNANTAQADRDGDGRGDACDDGDGDGVVDASDNCVTVANADQRDADRDRAGDACDAAGAAAPAPAGDGGARAAGGAAPADGGAPAAPSDPVRVSVRGVRAWRLPELGGGLAVPLTCSTGCRVAADLVAARAGGRRLRGAAARRLGTGTAELEAAGLTYVILDLDRGALRRLARRGLVATLRVTAVDAAGRRAVARRTVRIGR